MSNTAIDNTSAGAAAGDTAEARDYTHLFRSESLVSAVDLRVDVADSYSRLVAGDEDVELDVDELVADAPVTVSRGARTRRVGKYTRETGHEEVITVGRRIDETVHGGVHQKVRFAAEAMVGGAYANTIVGPYLRLAGWTDFLAWGGWAEVDLVRAELSLLMLRSHFSYAHATVARSTLASRLIDDFQTRTETFATLSESGVLYSDAASPGGGVTNTA